MLSFQPDADPTTPGTLSQCGNLVPTLRGGMRPGFVTSPAGFADGVAIGAQVVGTSLMQLPNGTYRWFAGTNAASPKLYDYSGSAFVDQSRSGGYTLDTGMQWLFSHYGNKTIATVYSTAESYRDYPQVSDTSGAFSNLSGAPKAKISVVQDNALYLFNLERNGTIIGDGWHRSDTGVLTNWTAEIDGGVGESAYGTFTEVPGPITAAIRRGGEVIAFKRRGMWRGRYVGFPQIVQWELIAAEVGCMSPKMVINIRDVLYFASASGVYKYDGSRPVPIDGGIRNAWVVALRAVGTTFATLQVGHDDELCVLYFMNTAGVNGYFAYNYVTGAWGFAYIFGTPAAGYGGNMDPGSFLNAPSEMVRASGFFTFSGTKSACICFGLNSLGTEGQPKFLSEGFSGGAATWEMPWVMPTAKQGRQIKRLYPACYPGREFPVSDVLAVVVTAMRNRGGGATQASAGGALSNGQIDVLANGTLFKIDYTAIAATVTSAGFEFLDHEIEFGDAAPKN